MNYIDNISELKNYIKATIEESFLHRSSDNLRNLIQSFKSLFLQMKFAVDGNEHRMDFFVNNIKKELICYRDYILNHYNKKNKKKFAKHFSEFFNSIDPEMLETIGVFDFISSMIDIIKNGEESIDISCLSIQDTINMYIVNLPEFADKAFNLYLKKIKNNEAYEPLKNINLPASKIPLKEYLRQEYMLQIEMLKLQEWLADKKVLIIFDGRDGAGKGSTIDFLTTNLNPKHYRIETWDIPDAYEKKHWFKRFWKKMPEKGEIVFFDRSWYNRAYAEIVMGYCNKKQYADFMDKVERFEKKIADSGITLIKIWLSITEDTQKLKFEIRKSNPLGYWKFSKNDEQTLEYWNEFTFYINKMLKNTNAVAPWHIIKSDDDRLGKIKTAKTILSMFDYDEKEQDVIAESDSKNFNKDSWVFSDIDGVYVLFKDESHVDHSAFNVDKDWNRENINNLNKLIEKTGAKVIVTSSYRKDKTKEDIENRMKKEGFKYEIYDTTSVAPMVKRGTLIKKYISDHNIKNFVIIDDNLHNIPELFPHNFVKLKTNIGFDDKSLNKALKILK